MTETAQAPTASDDELFDVRLAAHDRVLHARSLGTLQVNVGKLCNQACKHCHVDAGPHRDAEEDNLGEDVARLIMQKLDQGIFETLDLTGGAPELNPWFRPLVEHARARDVHVIDRCNLSVLFVEGQEDLAEFLARHRVEVVASLPFYSESRTDRQRGRGVFDASVRGLIQLNALGYGVEEALRLNLVYNPVGAYLPADQAQLEREFKERLQADWGIRFHGLYALANLPVSRFLDWLRKSGNLDAYREKLETAFNPRAADEVMCRDLISVGPDGSLYDCDFNQMLELEVHGGKRHLRDLDRGLERRRIRTGRHCFGCTAGAGSSCGGAVAADPAAT